jgi:hypothetical protein
MNSFSQASQDIFVRVLTKQKVNGTFLEIGSNDPIIHNNTYVLENENNWKGIMVELNKGFEDSYKINRPKSIYIFNDAQNVNYIQMLYDNNFPENIDYLQIDLDVDNRSTLNTLELLERTVFDKYKFATVTFEHDVYIGDYFNTQNISREIFKKRGYILVFPDVSVFWEGKHCKFEDWYVHPELIDKDIIDDVKSVCSLKSTEIADKLVKLIPK